MRLLLHALLDTRAIVSSTTYSLILDMDRKQVRWASLRWSDDVGGLLLLIEELC